MAKAPSKTADEVRKVVTPVFRLSFPHLFEAQSYDGGEPKFGGSAVWRPSEFSELDKKRWAVMTSLLNDKAIEGFKKPWKELPENIKRGLRKGEEKADLEGYGPGTWFANITSKMRPGIVLQDGKTKVNEENGNLDEIYPGCYCRATVTAYFYSNKGKGVALGINNLQKVKDGDRLDSRTDAAEDFEGAEDSEWMDDTSAEAPDDSGTNDFLE